MGILDQLKQQAESLRAAETDKAARLARQEDYYQASLRPAMLKILSYLDELVKHINYVQPERVLHYPLAPDRKTTIELAQGQYKLLIDSSDAPRQVDVRVTAKLTHTPIYTIPGLSAVRYYAEYLDAYGLPYHRQDALNGAYKVEKASFTLEGPLQHGVRIQTNAEQQCVEILLRNFGRAGVQRHRFEPSKIDDALLDRLGRVLLHDTDSLPAPKAIPEQTRQRWRATLDAAEQQAQEQDQHDLETAKIRDRLKKSWSQKMQNAKTLYYKKMEQGNSDQ